MHPRVRPYAPSDLDACRDLWRELTERHREIYDDPTIGGDDPGRCFDAHLERSDLAGVWVAEVEGSVAGLVGLLLAGGEAEVEPVVVRAGSRRRGIGRVLLRHAEAEARRLGARSLNIRPVARNVDAMRLFVSTGLDLVGHVQLFKTLEPTDATWHQGISLHGMRLRY